MQRGDRVWWAERAQEEEEEEEVECGRKRRKRATRGEKEKQKEGRVGAKMSRKTVDMNHKCMVGEGERRVGNGKLTGL